nr:hypothetical protein CFP56_70584 [Quercus suber]
MPGRRITLSRGRHAEAAGIVRSHCWNGCHVPVVLTSIIMRDWLSASWPSSCSDAALAQAIPTWTFQPQHHITRQLHDRISSNSLLSIFERMPGTSRSPIVKMLSAWNVTSEGPTARPEYISVRNYAPSPLVGGLVGKRRHVARGVDRTVDSTVAAAAAAALQVLRFDY